MFDSLKRKYHNYKPSLPVSTTNILSPPIIDIKVDIEENVLNLKSEFNNVSLAQKLSSIENQFILVGKLKSFRNIVSLMRKYTNRPFFLFTEDDLNLFLWREIAANYVNVYLIIGDFMNLEHIVFLNIEKSYKILILSDTEGTLFYDSSSICFVKIIEDHFQQHNYIVELRDE